MQKSGLTNLCQLKALFKALYRLEADIQQKHGLTMNEALMLCSLTSAPQSAGELAAELGTSPSRISRVADSLEKKGLIARSIDMNDKRRMIFMLTDRGLDKISDSRQSLNDIPDISLLLSGGNQP